MVIPKKGGLHPIRKKHVEKSNPRVDKNILPIARSLIKSRGV
jgi:hypothetical protein